MKLLVHACCAPCSIMPTRLLTQQGHDISVFYANSNIAPREEYLRRLRELENFAVDEGFAVIEGAYDPDAWEREVAPIGEALKGLSPALSPGEADATSVSELLDDERRRDRCRACYRLRLEEAAAEAAVRGCEGLATTLAVSPYQFTDVIREELERACSQAGIEALFEDYRPYYDEATRISRKRGMYRQNYCGCRFSIKEGEATRAFIRRQRAAQKAERAAQQAERRAADEKRLEGLAAEKRAYAEARAKRRALKEAYLRDEIAKGRDGS